MYCVMQGGYMSLAGQLKSLSDSPETVRAPAML